MSNVETFTARMTFAGIYAGDGDRLCGFRVWDGDEVCRNGPSQKCGLAFSTHCDVVAVLTVSYLYR